MFLLIYIAILLKIVPTLRLLLHADRSLEARWTGDSSAGRYTPAMVAEAPERQQLNSNQTNPLFNLVFVWLTVGSSYLCAVFMFNMLLELDPVVSRGEDDWCAASHCLMETNIMETVEIWCLCAFFQVFHEKKHINCLFQKGTWDATNRCTATKADDGRVLAGFSSTDLTPDRIQHFCENQRVNSKWKVC